MDSATSSRQQLKMHASGTGAPVVLVHGSWSNGAEWAPMADELAASFRVITYDRRGHGPGEDRSEDGTRRDDEDDLAGLLTEVGPDPVHVVANSFGSSVALGLAARRPELYRTLVVHEPPLLGIVADAPDTQDALEALAVVVSLIDQGEEETGSSMFVDQIAFGPGAWAAMPAADRTAMVELAPTFAGEQRDPDWARLDLALLATVTCPVLLTGGDQSPPLFGAIIDRLSRALPHSEVTTVRGAGHAPHLERTEDYVGTISRFLAG